VLESRVVQKIKKKRVVGKDDGLWGVIAQDFRKRRWKGKSDSRDA
jgi:hypothetical protein